MENLLLMLLLISNPGSSLFPVAPGCVGIPIMFFPPFSSHLRLAERDIDISFLRLCGVKLTEIPGLTLFNVTACWRSIPAEGRNLFSFKQGSIAHHLSLSPTHCLDMTEILLERI